MNQNDSQAEGSPSKKDTYDKMSETGGDNASSIDEFG